MTTTAKVAAAAALLCLLLMLVLAGPAACNRIRSLTAQTKVDTAQHGAFANSAQDAISTQGNVAESAAKSEELSRTNEEAIRHAEGANQPVSAASRNAAFASLCKRPDFVANPANRLRCTDPAVVAGASPGP